MPDTLVDDTQILPAEVLYTIFNSLPTKDLKETSYTCKFFNQVAKANFDRRHKFNWLKPRKALEVDYVSKNLTKPTLLFTGHVVHVNDDELQFISIPKLDKCVDFKIALEHYKLIDWILIDNCKILASWQRETSKKICEKIYEIRSDGFSLIKLRKGRFCNDKGIFIPTLLLPENSLTKTVGTQNKNLKKSGCFITAGYVENGKHIDGNFLFLHTNKKRKKFSSITDQAPIGVLKLLSYNHDQIYFLSANRQGNINVWKKSRNNKKPVLLHGMNMKNCLSQVEILDTQHCLLFFLPPSGSFVFNIQSYIFNFITGQLQGLSWKIPLGGQLKIIDSKLCVLTDHKFSMAAFERLAENEQFDMASANAKHKKSSCSIS